MVTREPGSMGFFRRLRRNRNAFAMLMFEPMWGIPYNLFIPYFYLYMNGLGCSPEQIGLINTVGMAFQVFFSLLAAPVADRFGRKRTTLAADLLSWSCALLIWIFCGNFWGFLAAAVVQATNRVATVSWTCLIVEDTEKDLLVKLFSWLTIAGLLAALFSPLAAALVNRFSVVSTVRWLLVLAFVMMTAMFFLRNRFTHETSVGVTRMAQSRKEPFFSQIAALFRSARELRGRRNAPLLFCLSAAYYAALAVKAPFFALLLTGALGFSPDSAGLFAAMSSLVMLAIYLFAQPVLSRLRPRKPLLAGLLLCAAGSLLLLPSFGSFTANIAAVAGSVLLTAVGTAVAQPFIDGLTHASMDNEKRANMTSLLSIFIMVASAPFGWIGGALYTWNSRMPFVAASVIFLGCMGMMGGFYRGEEGEKAKQ